MSRHNPKLLCSDAGQEPRGVLASFEGHFSEVTFGTRLPSKTGRRGSEWSKGKSRRDTLDRAEGI